MQYSIELDQPGKPETCDCRGDCTNKCMAIYGHDPACCLAMIRLKIDPKDRELMEYFGIVEERLS